MYKNLRWKILTIAAVTLARGVVSSRRQGPKVQLGLDLKGGVHSCSR